MLAFPHLEPTATAWPGVEGGGHPSPRKNTRDGAIVVVLRGAWFGRAACDAPALWPRLRRAVFEARAPDAREDARAAPPGEKSEAESLRRADGRGSARGARSEQVGDER